MSCCRRSVSSTPGYTYIKNNVTQTWAALGGFTVGRIKFTDKDVDELVNTFKANKKAN